MLRLVASMIVCTVLVSAEGLAQTCRSDAYTVSIPDDYEHHRWVGDPEPGDILVEFAGFTAALDGPDDDDNNPSTANFMFQPEWVAHEVRRHVDGGMFVYASGFERPRPWYEFSPFPNVPSVEGVTDIELDNSYDGEGRIWNRGHLATRSLVNRIGEEAGCNTHNFANAVPQYWSLNQGEWLALERYTGAIANQYGRAWAINGPVFLPGREIETVGTGQEARIPIPHGLFKVIAFSVDDELYVRAFLFWQPTYENVRSIMAATGGDNAPVLGYRLCRSTDQEDYDFTPYVSSLDEIESLTGITFFPDAEGSERRALNQFSSRGIWAIDRRFYPAPCGVD